MPENYDHYISKNIKAFYKRRLAAPIIYLIVLILAWHFFSLSAVFSPDILPDDTSLETAFRGGKQYISTTLSDLKFTGYTQSIFGHTNGYYYYTMRDEECIIVLLSPNTSEEGLPSIEEVTIKGKISKGNENFDTLLSNLSTDLNWTENGIRNKFLPTISANRDLTTLETGSCLQQFSLPEFTHCSASCSLSYTCFSRCSPLHARILHCLVIRKRC